MRRPGQQLIAGVQIAGLAALWLVALVPAAVYAGGAALFTVLRGPKAAV